MGMIVCKTCYDNQVNSWIETYNPDPQDPERLPPYNENGQHYRIYDVEEIASRLQNGEMIEIICSICKKTHVGKDENGVVKVRYSGGTWQNWQ